MKQNSEMASHCDGNVGKLKPIVDFNSCGAKADCVDVCPYDVFVMRPITDEDAKGLNLKGKLKTFFFKDKAYVVNPDLCHTCGLCVRTCPEKAIKLIRY